MSRGSRGGLWVCSPVDQIGLRGIFTDFVSGQGNAIGRVRPFESL